MLISCAKCKEMIPEAQLSQDAVTGDITIIVQHHGETDQMVLTQVWMKDNQDFVYMINNNMTVGEAFKETEDA